MSGVIGAVMDTLLPGGAGFPSASEAGASDWIMTEERLLLPLRALADRLPPDFADMALPWRAETLAAMEAASPALFSDAVVSSYSAYYTRPAVLAVVEAACGYKARAPQPGGYDVPPFDPDLLAIPRSRAASWRNPRTETGA
jgi:hypothetical protein